MDASPRFNADDVSAPGPDAFAFARFLDRYDGGHEGTMYLAGQREPLDLTPYEAADPAPLPRDPAGRHRVGVINPVSMAGRLAAEREAADRRHRRNGVAMVVLAVLFFLLIIGQIVLAQAEGRL